MSDVDPNGCGDPDCHPGCRNYPGRAKPTAPAAGMGAWDMEPRNVVIRGALADLDAELRFERLLRPHREANGSYSCDPEVILDYARQALRRLA